MPPKLQWMSCKHPCASSGTFSPNSASNRSFQAAGRSTAAQIAGQQREFQLEAQRDVQVVRRLVRLHADERRPHVVDGEVERLLRHVRERRRERLLEAREEVVPERPPAADLVLPQPRLRLVDAERARDAERRAEVVRGKVLLVHPVAGFVQHAEERFAEEPRVVPRGDAAVAGAERRSRTGARWCPAGRRAKSNPTATAAASANTFCRSIGNSRSSTLLSGCFGEPTIFRTSGASSAVNPANSSFNSATVVPGSYSSMSASYRWLL